MILGQSEIKPSSLYNILKKFGIMAFLTTLILLMFVYGGLTSIGITGSVASVEVLGSVEALGFLGGPEDVTI